MAFGETSTPILAYCCWIIALLCLFVTIMALIIRWRRKFPPQPPPSGASGSTGTVIVVIVTGPTGYAGFAGVTGLSGKGGVTGPTGQTGTNLRVDQIGDLTDAIVTGIMGLNRHYGFGVVRDLRSSFVVPSTLFGNKSLHLLQWMPDEPPQWFDFGPWVGPTGGTGWLGATGPNAIAIGPTGATGPYGIRGVTGITGIQGQPGTVGPFYGSLYGPGVVNDPPPAEDWTVITTNTTLTADLYARNLSVQAGTLFTNGYRIFVQNQFQIVAPGIIDNSGGNGAAAVVGPQTSMQGGGQGGAGGVFLPGGNGGAGTNSGFANPGADSLYTVVLPGQSVSSFYGGGDNSNQNPTGGKGGFVLPVSHDILQGQLVSVVRPTTPFPHLLISGGSGGGGGSSTTSTVLSASGGGGGGVIALFVGTFLAPVGGFIRARGGNGGNSATSFDSPGAGGGGGLILIRTQTPSATVLSQYASVFNVSGGAGGNGSLGASSSGNPGQIVFLSP